MSNDLIDFGSRLSRDFRDQHRAANDQMMNHNMSIADMLMKKSDGLLLFDKSEDSSPLMDMSSSKKIKQFCTKCHSSFESTLIYASLCSSCYWETQKEEKEIKQKAEESCCYITSACLDDLDLSRDSVEMTALKTLTKEHILKSFGGMRDYLLYGKRAPRIVEAIRARADSREIWLGVDACLKDVASLVASGKYEDGYRSYKSLVLGLEKRFK